MKKSLQILEEISSKCSSHTTIYKFNKDIPVSEKYREGRITASTWLNDLIYYYISKERSFINEFQGHIQEQKIKLDMLNEGEYKKGIYDQLNEIENMVNDRVK